MKGSRDHITLSTVKASQFCSKKYFMSHQENQSYVNISIRAGDESNPATKKTESMKTLPRYSL